MFIFFFFNDPTTTEIYTLSLHDALPIYISPQVWAWKEGRVKKMKQNIDKMLVILPFEKEYYKNKWNWDVEYVGHPLVQVIENYKSKHLQQSSIFNVQHSTSNIVALLPGSRKQEILKKLPIMLEVSR